MKQEAYKKNYKLQLNF